MFQLVKHHIIPPKDGKILTLCSNFKDKLCEKEVHFVEDFEISALEQLLKGLDTLKRKFVYIAEFFVDKYGLAGEPEEDAVSNEFLEEINRGGLWAVMD